MHLLDSAGSRPVVKLQEVEDMAMDIEEMAAAGLTNGRTEARISCRGGLTVAKQKLCTVHDHFLFVRLNHEPYLIAPFWFVLYTLKTLLSTITHLTIEFCSSVKVTKRIGH